MQDLSELERAVRALQRQRAVLRLKRIFRASRAGTSADELLKTLEKRLRGVSHDQRSHKWQILPPEELE